jgi:glycosyltransferase involved in cell wall biosynthesis
MHRPLSEPYYDPADVLMVGISSSAVMYYRVLLPAHALGIDYVGVWGEPPEVAYRTGLVGGKSVMPDFTRYKLVVLQQPRGEGWLKIIRALRERGTVVVYEVDDYLHGIKHVPGHAFIDKFQNKDLSEYEKCMKACDAMIVSTPFLASVYRPFHKRIFLCENGFDKRRAIATPFAAIEQYPAAMTMLDVAIAPGGETGFHRAKSDLRWLEAGALGIPLVGHPDIYRHIVHGVTGFHARNAREAKPLIAELVDDKGLRMTLGENARSVVRANRDMHVMSDGWRQVFNELSGVPQLAG